MPDLKLSIPKGKKKLTPEQQAEAIMELQVAYFEAVISQHDELVTIADSLSTIALCLARKAVKEGLVSEQEVYGDESDEGGNDES